jgi:PTS system cellobiose-specific IIB component
MKVILLCALGMSTSLLVENMKKAANEQGIEVEVVAHSVDQFEKYLSDADVMLLGPQIRYKYRSLSKAAEAANVPLAVIDTLAYGMDDGHKVLKQATDLIKKKGN